MEPKTIFEKFKFDFKNLTKYFKAIPSLKHDPEEQSQMSSQFSASLITGDNATGDASICTENMKSLQEQSPAEEHSQATEAITDSAMRVSERSPSGKFFVVSSSF